jgi:hypothetical protein
MTTTSYCDCEGVPGEKIGAFDEEMAFSRAPVGFVETGA